MWCRKKSVSERSRLKFVDDWCVKVRHKLIVAYPMPILPSSLLQKPTLIQYGSVLGKYLVYQAPVLESAVLANEKKVEGTSLVVQWLRLRTPNAAGLGFHPWSGN